MKRSGAVAIALTLPECRHTVEAARGAQGIVMTGFQMRRHRMVREAKEVIRSGRLGRIESIRSVWNSPRTRCARYAKTLKSLPPGIRGMRQGGECHASCRAAWQAFAHAGRACR